MNRYYIQKQIDNACKNKIFHTGILKVLNFKACQEAGKKKMSPKNKNVTSTTKIFNKQTLALFLYNSIPKEL